MYGKKKMQAHLESIVSKTPVEIVFSLYDDFMNFNEGTKWEDDISFVAITRK